MSYQVVYSTLFLSLIIVPYVVCSRKGSVQVNPSHYMRYKSILDALFSVFVLIFMAPIFVLVSVVIKLCSRGPVFYFQERVGLNGKLISIIKFRTMHVHAEKESGPVWCNRFDQRVFPFGSFLRRHHLDELPQFINVLRGEMSIIGPRPERPFFVEKFNHIIPHYYDRQRVRPGITGYAQISQAYDATTEDVRHKIKLDLFYIKNMSFFMDLKISWDTLCVMLTGNLLSGEISEGAKRPAPAYTSTPETEVSYSMTSNSLVSE